MTSGMSFSFRIFSFIRLNIVSGMSLSMNRCSFNLFCVFLVSRCRSLFSVYSLLRFSCFSLFSFIFDRKIVKRFE